MKPCNTVRLMVARDCPDGWHLPSDAEWTEMVNTLGATPGSKLRQEAHGI